MWIVVFEAIESPSDLLRLVRTCKHFYSLAIRVLYREVRWMGPFLYAQNVSFWNRHAPSMALVPASLTVGISLVSDNSYSRVSSDAPVVEEDGSCRVGPDTLAEYQITPSHPIFRGISFYASRRMYNAIAARMSTFKVLRELVFHLSDLPDTIFSVIKLLPRLRHLAIQYCTLPIMHLEPDPSFSELPLTELTLWYNKGDSDTVPNSNYVYTLYLCTAKNLHTLRVDWTPVTARFLSLQNPGAPIAPLTKLKEVMIRLPSTKIWPAEESDYIDGDCFASFLAASPGITRFSCVNRKIDLELPDTVMPYLKYYSGTISPVVELVASRPVEHIDLVDFESVSDVLSTLTDMAEFKPRLQTLCFAMKRWDDEVLYALASLFVDLRRVQVKFSSGFVPEQTLLSLGSLFLNKFPALEILQIYRKLPKLPSVAEFEEPIYRSTRGVARASSTRAPADDEEEVIRCLNAWRKPCPLLRQVQLTDGFIWRRAFSGDEWCKRPSPPVSKASELY
ncbi:hypothetical protein FPV67DRAFT_1530351 [Lyophyllum atratum]|nr:hypothetical protein FPV67DRAFT_1530351 [Lyophyllum atratum]